MKFYLWMWNKKSMKLHKSLGGRIAHLEVPSSRKFLNPPNKLKSKKRECQAKQFIITRPSMQGFSDWWKYVSVWSISNFWLLTVLLLYWNGLAKQTIFIHYISNFATESSVSTKHHLYQHFFELHINNCSWKG